MEFISMEATLNTFTFSCRRIKFLADLLIKLLFNFSISSFNSFSSEDESRKKHKDSKTNFQGIIICYLKKNMYLKLVKPI